MVLAPKYYPSERWKVLKIIKPGKNILKTDLVVMKDLFTNEIREFKPHVFGLTWKGR